MGSVVRDIIVFGGPSLPILRPMGAVEYRPPVSRGYLTAISERHIAVILDGLFLHSAAATHSEYLALVRKGVTLIGAASIGALRAVELRDFGVIGTGAAYRAYRSGVVLDDSELAVAVCPFTYRALSISLFDVRGLLAGSEARGANAKQLREAFTIAQNTPFWERTWSYLHGTWAQTCPEIAADFRSCADAGAWKLKELDAIQAIELGLQLRNDPTATSRITSQNTKNPSVSLYTQSGSISV